MQTGADHKLVVGLGNPGNHFAGTRHNVGFDVVDELGRRHNAAWETAPRYGAGLVWDWRMPARRITVFKPETFMNRGGPAVVGLLQFFKISTTDLLVVVDDVNLEVGRLRAKASGSAGGHNGLKSMIEALGTDEFARLRVGVGRGDKGRDLANRVLGRFEEDEGSLIADAVKRAADAVEMFALESIHAVMNRFNRKEDRNEETE